MLFVRRNKGYLASLVPNLGCEAVDMFLRRDKGGIVALTYDHDWRAFESPGLVYSIDPVRNHSYAVVTPTEPRTQGIEVQA